MRNAGYIQLIEPFLRKRKDLVIETGDAPVDPELLLSPVRFASIRPGSDCQVLVIIPEPAMVKKACEYAAKIPRIRTVGLGADDVYRKEAERITTKPEIVIGTPDRIIDFLRRDDLPLSHVKICIVHEPDESNAAGFNADLRFIFSRFTTLPRSVIFSATIHVPAQEIVSLFRRPSYINIPDLNRKEPPMKKKNRFDHDTMKKTIRDIVRRIHESEDPDDLNEYRRMVNKNVSFFVRGYFAAYLLKQLTSGSPAAIMPGSKANTSAEPQRTASSQNGDMSSIFVGIGKNKRVFPKDLFALFSNVDGLEGSDLGQIKILDNYSFVEVTPEKATTAIESLNGTEFRGRKLNVNFAKKKD